MPRKSLFFQITLFGNHVKEFVKGKILSYTRQRRSNKKLYIIKGSDYLRAKKMTIVKLSPCGR